jgi:hypothetical protein
MGRTSDDDARARNAVAADLAALEEASTAAKALLAQLQEKTRRPHDCHVCGNRLKEDSE